MLKDQAIGQLKTMQHFFKNTISCFTEADSGFAPKKEMFTVANHVAHAAETIPWFIEGAFGKKGFDLDFEAGEKRIRQFKSFEEALAKFDREVESAVAAVAKKSDQELMGALPAGPIMGGLPVMAIFPALTDHTAHHRGALTVYARLVGKVPKMPYMD